MKSKILVVDNEECNRTLICLFLKGIPLEIFCAKSGKEALKILNVNNIDVVLTDICMPEMDGIDLAWNIKENYAGISVISMTASSVHEELTNPPFDYSLPLPISKRGLLEVLSKLKAY